jgi:hypothetical protein
MRSCALVCAELGVRHDVLPTALLPVEPLALASEMWTVEIQFRGRSQTRRLPDVLSLAEWGQ